MIQDLYNTINLKMLYNTTFMSVLEVLIVVVPVLLTVAFVTVAETNKLLDLFVHYYTDVPKPYQTIIILQSGFNYDPLRILSKCLAISISFILMIYKFIMVDHFGFDLTNIKDFSIVIVPCSVISPYIINFVIGTKNFSHIKSGLFSIVLALSCFFIRPLLIKYLSMDISIVAYFFALYSAVKGCTNTYIIFDAIFTSKSINKEGENIIDTLDCSSKSMSPIEIQDNNLVLPKGPQTMTINNLSPEESIKEKSCDVCLMEGLPGNTEDQSAEDPTATRSKGKQVETASEDITMEDAKAVKEPKIDASWKNRFSKTDARNALADARAKLYETTGLSIFAVEPSQSQSETSKAEITSSQSKNYKPSRSADRFSNQTKQEADAQSWAWTQAQAQAQAQIEHEAQVEAPKPSLMDICLAVRVTCEQCLCGNVSAINGKNVYVNEHVKYMWEAFLEIGEIGLNSNTEWWKSLSDEAKKCESKVLRGLLEDRINFHVAPDHPKKFTEFFNKINQLERDGVIDRESSLRVKNAMFRAGKAYHTHIFPHEKIIKKIG